MPKVARPHQKAAVRACVKGFRTHARGQVIMACGTGKTLVGILVVQSMKLKRVLVLAPSIGLIAQLIRYWREDARTDFAMLAVCGDGTVAADNDSFDENGVGMSVAELAEHTGVEVTTDPDQISKFIKSDKPFVVFSTYASSSAIQFAQHRRGTSSFDIAIADEAHRCASYIDGQWVTIVRENAILADRRLFMTATPRIFRVPRGRTPGDMGGGDVIAASMDNKELFGPEFYKLNFMESVRRGLLCELRVLVSVVTNSEVMKLIRSDANVSLGREVFGARGLALHVAVHKAMVERKLSKVISFHSRVFRAKDFAHMHELALHIMRGKKAGQQLWTGHTSAKDDSQTRLRILTQFAKCPKKMIALLTNARCLTEGVDVPAVDGVVFADPCSSVVSIVQAIGRAMRKSPGKKFGTVVVPVFVQDSADLKASASEVWEDVFDDSTFQTVRRVFLALRMADESVDVMFSNLSSKSRGKIHGSPDGEAIVRPRFVPHSEVTTGIRSGKMVESSGEDVVAAHIKDGRLYDDRGREVVVRLPKMFGVSYDKQSKSTAAAFTSAIANRLVRWNTTSIEEKINLIADFVKKNNRIPNPRSPSRHEQALAAVAKEVRAIGRAAGFSG